MTELSRDVVRQLHRAEMELLEVDARSEFLLYRFGDHLADREGYKEVEALEAIQFYLMQKHHWLPAQVKSLSTEDIRFALKEEMSGWSYTL